MDKFYSKSELNIKTDVELQVTFRLATEKLSSPDADTVKKARHALQKIKAVQQAKKLQP